MTEIVDARMGDCAAVNERPNYRALFAAWQARRDDMKRDAQVRKGEADKLFAERNRERWAAERIAAEERRREKDRDYRRAKRGKTAATVQDYDTARKHMTPQQRAEHDAAKASERQRRRRRKLKLVERQQRNKNFGRF